MLDNKKDDIELNFDNNLNFSLLIKAKNKWIGLIPYKDALWIIFENESTEKIHRWSQCLVDASFLKSNFHISFFDRYYKSYDYMIDNWTMKD